MAAAGDGADALTDASGETALPRTVKLWVYSDSPRVWVTLKITYVVLYLLFETRARSRRYGDRIAP